MHKSTYPVTFFVIILTSLAFAIDVETDKEIREKIATYSKMETTGRTLKAVGWVLIGTGVAFIPIGVAIAVNADNESGEMGGVMLGGVGGGIGIGFGMIGAIAGGVLKGIGRDKKAEYEKRLSIKGVGNGLAIAIEW